MPHRDLRASLRALPSNQGGQHQQQPTPASAIGTYVHTSMEGSGSDSGIGGIGGALPPGSGRNAFVTMYPAGFIRRRLVKGSGYFRDALVKLSAMDHEAQTKACECLTAEDELVERAAELLTSKETTAEEIAAFLASDDFKRLEAGRAAVGELRSKLRKVVQEAYDRLDGDICAYDKEMAALEPQIAADLAVLDPVALAVKQKMLRQQQKQEKEKVKVISKKAYRELKKKQQGLLALNGQPGDAAAGPDAGALEEVDPNEPVYCHCQRISSGTMVGCDNEDCRFEWFHLECVGLAAPPPDGTEWLCPECAAQKTLPQPLAEEGEAAAAAAAAGEGTASDPQPAAAAAAAAAANDAAGGSPMSAEEAKVGTAVDGGPVEEGEEEGVAMELGGEGDS